MKALLDTHVWLWMLTDPGKLGQARSLIEDGRHELCLSAASSWEIAIKYALGRLPLPSPPAVYLPDRIRSTGVKALAIEHAHALEVATLPHHHRDPFDRLLIAQAIALDMPILTSDGAFENYGVDIIRVG